MAIFGILARNGAQKWCREPRASRLSSFSGRRRIFLKEVLVLGCDFGHFSRSGGVSEPSRGHFRNLGAKCCTKMASRASGVQFGPRLGTPQNLKNTKFMCAVCWLFTGNGTHKLSRRAPTTPGLKVYVGVAGASQETSHINFRGFPEPSRSKVYVAPLAGLFAGDGDRKLWVRVDCWGLWTPTVEL